MHRLPVSGQKWLDSWMIFLRLSNRHGPCSSVSYSAEAKFQFTLNQYSSVLWLVREFGYSLSISSNISVVGQVIVVGLGPYLDRLLVDDANHDNEDVIYCKG